jgi:hypothetical protein
VGGSFRPIYEDEVVAFQRDTTSRWASLPGVSSSVTATNFQQVLGSGTWTILIPPALTSQVGVSLTVQVNFSNPIVRSDHKDINWTVNPLQNQPSMNAKTIIAINSGFTASWQTIGVVATGTPVSAFSIPARYVRLTGAGVNALSGSNSILIWHDGMSQGN